MPDLPKVTQIERVDLRGPERIMENIQAIVLAGGKGTRLNCNDCPKAMLPIAGKPMVDYSLENLKKAGFAKPVIVVGFHAQKIKEHLGNKVIYAYQREQLGTADAVKSAEPKISKDIKNVLSIYGDDSAFYKPETIKNFVNDHLEKQPAITLLTVEKDNPTGLGRIIRNQDGFVVEIVEEKLATDEQKKIKEINTGCCVFRTDFLWPALKKVKKNPVGEYYLTDLIEIARNEHQKVNAYKIDASEWIGINTAEDLKAAEEAMKKKNQYG